MGEKRYPIGIQSFSKIIEGNYHYVDKTDLVYQLANAGAPYIFLSRPRRFGKSLLVSTLHTYFEGKKEYFKGLAIDELETEWISYPIIHMDFSEIKSDDPKCIKEDFNDLLEEIYKDYGFEVEEIPLGRKLRQLVKKLYKKFSQQVVILIDEYDTPILNVFHSEEKLAAVRQSMRELFAPIKALDNFLRFVFITGITKFSQLSIFSELNNINNVSFQSKYASICGITAEELQTYFACDIDLLARKFNKSSQEMYAELKNRYDGFHFCWPSQDIYNPISILKCFDEGKLSNWWYATGTSAFLVKMLQASTIDISHLGECTVSAFTSMFDAPIENNPEPLAFLYQAGYLTIKNVSSDGRFYELGIPNKEVHTGLIDQLLPYYTGQSKAEAGTFIISLSDALAAEDIDNALSLLRSYLASIPYDLAAKDEKQFQAQLYVLLNAIDANVTSEVRTSTGRIDFLMRKGTHCYIVELKYNQSASVAIDLIKEKDYALAFMHGADEIILVGVNYDPEERTISDDWQVEKLQ